MIVTNETRPTQVDPGLKVPRFTAYKVHVSD